MTKHIEMSVQVDCPGCNELIKRVSLNGSCLNCGAQVLMIPTRKRKPQHDISKTPFRRRTTDQY